MTIFSDAYLPYPYGPVPSPGTPSPKFVDLLNNQTVGGDKTFSGRTSIARPAQVGGAEEHLRFTVSDDAAASLVLLNGDTTDGAFVPVVAWNGTVLSSSYTAGQQRVRLGAGMDTGSTPAMAYFFQTSTGAALASRPLCGWYSGVTLMMDLIASGDLRLKQAGAGVRIAEGANCKQGVATLVAGTVTVANTRITANSRIHATGQDNNVTGTVRISTRTPGVSFTLTSTNAADSGVVAYTIFEPS
mgnify:CR=1 FL=1|jgi:hypothetical protein|nr:MAG TPA: hypothetical protein [Caudoviricetes sp.]